MRKNNINNTRQVLAEDMKKYVQLILKEYKNFIPKERQEFLIGISDYYSRVTVEDRGTISMFATNNGIVMPESAYRIFRLMKFIPGYGVNKKHKSFNDGEIVNENTYYDYIKHVFVSGMSVEEFFRDTVLHETMHFCGAGGGKAIREGFTELKTRELAQKYGLKASRAGYPQEVDIAYRFQKLVGKEIGNKITFARTAREISEILQEKYGNDIVELFFDISYLMDREQKAKYDHSKFGGLFSSIKKAKAYSEIDYSKVFEKLKAFEQEKKDNFIQQKKYEEQKRTYIKNTTPHFVRKSNFNKKENEEIEL